MWIILGRMKHIMTAYQDSIVQKMIVYYKAVGVYSEKKKKILSAAFTFIDLEIASSWEIYGIRISE